MSVNEPRSTELHLLFKVFRDDKRRYSDQGLRNFV